MARTDGTNVFSQILLWLAIVGALNWGLVGFFDWDLVRAIFGGESSTPASGLSRIVYALVGLAGLGLLFLAPRLRAAGTAHRTTAAARV
jgi:uncharacterized membrane protein YuzA (DUF378 family)